jgi:DNA-binding CsgD family transcriptional regulator
MLLKSGNDLVERERELAYLDDRLGALQRAEGSCALVEGPAGVGKTSLLGKAVERAEAVGLHVLGARCGELEREFPYGVVRQLFERSLRAADESARAELLEGAAGLAAPVLGFESPGPVAAAMDAPFATVHGLYWLAAGMAAKHPLVLAVDDVHWADGPSLRWLTYLVRRLEGVPLLVLLANRHGEPEQSGVIDAIKREPLVRVIDLGALSDEGVAEIVAARIPEASSGFCEACHRVSGGNPLYLRELLDAAIAAHVPPSSEGERRLESLGPANIASAVIGRMRDRGPGAEAVARALAVLDADSSLRRVAELAVVDEGRTAELIDRLVEARVLAGGEGFQFKHPVVRTAIYEAVPPAERVRLHAAAFSLLRAEGAAPDRLAGHLLMVEPGGHPDAVGTLRAAAELAQARGAPDLAARYLERALREAPANVEQPTLTHDLGMALLARGDPAAFEHLRRAIDMTSVTASREVWSLELVRALGVAGRPQQLVDFAAAALRAGISDRALAVRIESELIGLSWMIPEATRQALARLAELERAGVPSELEHVIVVHRALRVTVEGGPAAQAISLAQRAIEGGVLFEENSSLPFMVLAALIWNDELEGPRQLCDGALALAQQIGSLHLTVNAGLFGALVALRAGRLADAAGGATMAYEIERASAMPGMGWGWALAVLLDALRERGELDAAQELLRAADAEGELPALGPFVFLRESRGRLRYAQGRLAEGVADLLETGRRYEQFAVVNPTASAWRSDAALALFRLGQLERAGELADRELELARAAGTPRGVGVALRCSGIVHRDEQLLAEAVDVLAGSPARLEYARALCELAAARRRAGRRRDVREPLLTALDLARRCTAAPLAERIRAELAAIGSRPRRDFIGGVESLTPGELRVARMAADGRSNKDIAQALFLTLRTVETHLTHVYRKLDIDSRSALQEALSGAPAAA